MDAQKVTNEQMQESAKKYGLLIYTHAYMFTEDDWKAAKVREQVIWDIPIILAAPEEPENSYASQILLHVRSASIALLKDNPLFNPWELWKQEPYYFCFLEPGHPAFHNEIFWYLFFRDIPLEEVIKRYDINSDEARQLVKEMFSEIMYRISDCIAEQSKNWLKK